MVNNLKVIYLYANFFINQNNNKMKIYFPKMISFLFGGALLLSSCGGSDKKDESPEDLTAPTISTEVPTANQAFSLGGSLHYTGTFTDDLELKEVVFSVKKTTAIVTAGLNDPNWAPSDVTVSLTGKEDAVNDNILEIPSGVNDGVYQLTIVCSDASGKETTENIVFNLGSTTY